MDDASPDIPLRPASQTALGAAALRIAHQVIDDEPKVIDDPVLLRLVEPETIDRIRAAADAFRHPRAAGLRVHIIVRQRYAEDRLAEAYRRGVRQYVIIGAGLDTFAYRQPAWAHDLRIFEVDQPESQRKKRERLEKAGVAIPPNLTFATVDLEAEPLRDGLSRQGFDPTKPAFAACLGVLVYLSDAANDNVYRFVASLPPPSELVLTFAAPRAEADGSAGAQLAARAADLGEPFRTFITAEDLDAKLRALGFSDVTILDPSEVEQRYLSGRTDSLRPPRKASVASARV